MIGIVRAHLEEDAAKTVHVGGRTGRIGGAEASLVDYNRGGTPLVEIVTAPDIRSADEAKRFLQLLRQTIVELGISDAEMEKGTLRVDANVSVRPAGSDVLRTRTELKNMNSFNFIARGIEAEVERQIGVWESGEEVRQQTYDFDAATGTLTARRAKEEADDYRYFPSRISSLSSRRRSSSPRSEPSSRSHRHRGSGASSPRSISSERRLVTGGLDRLWDETVAAGADAVAAANVVANTSWERGSTRAVCRRRSSRSWSRHAIASRGQPSTKRSPSSETRASRPSRTLLRRPCRTRTSWPDRRAHPRGAPGSGRRVPRRQGRTARLLRRPGDEGDAGEGEPACRLRARAREARRLAVLGNLELTADIEARALCLHERRHRALALGLDRREPVALT